MKRFIVFYYFLLFSCILGKAQEPFYAIDNSKELLTANTKCLLLDHTGFLWVGTDQGLFRYDGVNTISYTYNKADTASISSNEIIDITEDNDHQIWVATTNGICILSNAGNHIKRIQLPQNQQPFKRVINCQGKIVACSEKDVWKSLYTTHEFKKTLSFSSPFNFVKTTNCLLAFNSKELFISKDGDRFSKHLLPSIISKDEFEFCCAFNDSILLFFDKKGKGYYQFNLSNHLLRFDSFQLKNASPIRWVSCISHQLYFQNDNGLHLFDLERGQIKPINFPATKDLKIQDVIQDKNGTVFLATSKGLFIANQLHQQFQYIEIPYNNYSGLCFDTKGNHYLVSEKEVVVVSNPQKKILKADKILKVNFSDELLILKKGVDFFLDNLSSSNLFRLALPDKFQPNNCLFAIKDEAEQIWILFPEKGLIKYDINTKQCQWVNNNSINLLPNETRLVETVFGNQLFINIYGKSELLIVNTQTNGIKTIDLNQINGWKEQKITSMACNRANELWLGTDKNGIINFDLQHLVLKKYFSDEHHGNLSVSSFHFDAYNQLWCTTNYGLKKIAPQTGKIMSFSSSDGLPDNNLEQAMLCKTATDSIGLLMENKLVSFHPLNISSSPFTPKAIFLSFNKSGVDYPITDEHQSLTANYNDKNLTFSFTAINYIDPDKTRFAYTLENYECGWNYTDVNPIATYNNLPEGDYELKVKASNIAGYWDVPTTSILIHINGPFWYKWWFYGMCVIAFLTIVYIVYYIRIQQLLRIASIRDKISKDLHDDIGSALSSINIYGATAKKLSEAQAPEISNLLDNLQQTAETTMENMSDIVWAINPENDNFLEIMNRIEAFSRQILEAKGINFIFEVDEHIGNLKLSMLQRRNFYFIVKEAINNAAKYSKANQCSIIMIIEHKQMIVKISDDGQGFDLKKQNNFGGNGIGNMEKRAHEMKGFLQVETSNKGTSITLAFPVHL